MMGASENLCRRCPRRIRARFRLPDVSRQCRLRRALPVGHSTRSAVLISKRLVEIAAETGADAVAHGATGQGQ